MTWKYLVNKIFSVLSIREKSLLFIILISIFLSGVLEMLTISSIIPFLDIMLTPNIVYENFKYKYLVISKELFEKNPLGYISIIFILIISTATFLKLLVLKLILKVTTIVGSKVSSMVFNNIISQSYLNFTKFNTSKLISILESKIDPLVNSIFKGLQTISSVVITLSIVSTLFLIDFLSTMFFFVAFTISYLTLFYLYKRDLKRIGHTIAENLRLRVKISQEAMSIFRQVKLDNLTDKFYSHFVEKDFDIRKGQETSAYIGNFPRILIECIAIILIAIASYFLISKNIYDRNYTFTLIASIVFGASRLLPQIQVIYYNFSQLTMQKRMYLDVSEFIYTQDLNIQKIKKNNPIQFNNEIRLKNVSFGYIKDQNIFENVDLIVKKNSIIGILGKTGSGKTTLVDIISGLIPPTKGNIFIDDKIMIDHLESWNKKISYIDQSTTLLDASIIENIALGKNSEEINEKFLENVLEKSQSKEFINNLPNKLNTMVGERGVRLSGGQIQRIGIARALFKNSELLILDEPTSSLDNTTESLVIDGIKKLKREKTIILISHRVNTLKNCDKIYEVKDKKISEVQI